MNLLVLADTKYCQRCKEVKPKSDFNKKASRADGLNPWCRKCVSDYRKDRYNDRKAQGLEPATAQWQRDNKDKLNAIRNNKRAQIRDWIRALKMNKPCADCGKHYPPTCMDFDHRDPDQKEFNICGDATRELYSQEKILEEVAKCDIVCANCHRIRSAIQRGEDPAEYDSGMWGL